MERQDLEIKSIERLKFRDVRNNKELKDSSTVKIDFVSNFLNLSPYGASNLESNLLLTKLENVTIV